MTTRELAAIARDLVPPVGATGVGATVEHTPGSRLPSGDPTGAGGRTRYRAAWIVGHRVAVPAGPAFERSSDAIALAVLMGGEGAG